MANVETGRWLVIAVIVSALAVSVLNVAAFSDAVGTDREPQQVIRFVLTVGLCILLYRRANWARWVAGILFSLAAVGSLITSVASDRGDFLLAVIGAVYAAAAISLLCVPAVRAHFGVGVTQVG